MSHVAEFAFSVPRDRLLALKMAVERFCPTLEFAVDEKTYRTWQDDHGSLVGDWPLPSWLKAGQVGKNADHVIRLKDSALSNKNRKAFGAPYEIGVVPVQVERDENGKEISCQYAPNGNEYKLVCDFYNQGNGILTQPGVGKSKSTRHGVDAFDELKMFYQIALDELVAEENGDKLGDLEKAEDGSYFRNINTEARVGA